MAALSHLQNAHTGEDTSRRAFVGNLPWDLSEDEIKDHFVGTCGAVTAVTIFLRHDQKVRAGVCVT
jgi:RNA recognition motif-containing protein